jgi:aryl-alcohol dehydrogenase-like predicted oxidoreductase
MDFHEPRILGRTGLKVGRLGVAGGYGAPAAAFEEAFERGCNYFYWGSLRRAGMAQAIKNLCGRGKRGELVIVIQSYARSSALMEIFGERALKSLNIQAADVLLLGWHNRRPPARLLDRALALKERGKFRFLGLSGHNRKLFPELAQEGIFDVFHLRYNAIHRGVETEAFPALQELPPEERPGLVTYTATRWGQLLKDKRMPPGEPAPTAADCYRFALSHPAVDVCMTGPKDLAQMREDLRALDLGPLTETELVRLRRLGDHLRGRVI